jgi:hypothetical protein
MVKEEVLKEAVQILKKIRPDLIETAIEKDIKIKFRKEWVPYAVAHYNPLTKTITIDKRYKTPYDIAIVLSHELRHAQIGALDFILNMAENEYNCLVTEMQVAKALGRNIYFFGKDLEYFKKERARCIRLIGQNGYSWIGQLKRFTIGLRRG